MGVSCQIIIKRPNEGFYKPHCSVKGTIEYIIDKAEEYESIILSLIGKGKCKWKENNCSWNITSINTYKGEEETVIAHENIHEMFEKHGQTLVPEGIYTKDFCYIIPEAIPSTFKDKFCVISYKIEVEFVKSSVNSSKKERSVNSSKKFDAAIIVSGNLLPCSPEPYTFSLQKELTNSMTSKKQLIKLTADVDKMHVIPGECIKLALTIQNQAKVYIKSVRTELIRYTTYTAKCGKKKELTKILKETREETPRIKQDRITKLLTIVPTLPYLLSIQHSKIITRTYKIKVTVRLPMPYTDTTVEVPIVIGDIQTL